MVGRPVALLRVPRHGTYDRQMHDTDLSHLIADIQDRAAEIVANGELAESIAVTLGDAIAGLRSDAGWLPVERAVEQSGDRSVGNDSIRFTPRSIVTRLVEGNAADARELERVIRQWAEETAPLDVAALHPTPVTIAGYVRPTLPTLEFRNSDGNVIPYGRRWAVRPPDDSYSVVSHPERYALLHTVADALIEHLAQEFDVELSDDSTLASDLINPQTGVVRAVRLAPSDPNAAPLTLVFTGFPGVIVHAGVLHDFAFPSCGCDACDEPLDSLVEQFEQTVLGVASGGYGEAYPAGMPGRAAFSMSYPDGSGSSSGEGEIGDIPNERLEDAETRLRANNGPWHPWPRARD